MSKTSVFILVAGQNRQEIVAAAIFKKEFPSKIHQGPLFSMSLPLLSFHLHFSSEELNLEHFTYHTTPTVVQQSEVPVSFIVSSMASPWNHLQYFHYYKFLTIYLHGADTKSAYSLKNMQNPRARQTDCYFDVLLSKLWQ